MSQDVRPHTQKDVSFGEAFRYWVKLGFINFGGPTGQIALMHTDLVERKRWSSEERLLHALNYCMLLPGPSHSMAFGATSGRSCGSCWPGARLW
ncbi:putative chromate transport protein [bacterium HR08]|nr:putative chromate transport protein [bacterium HR08]